MRRSAILAAVILLVCSSYAFALDPSLDINRYAHTAWKVGEALPNGAIRALAQTADGYLWIGTESGLLRFDGLRAVPWQPPTGEHLPTDDIRSVLGAADGRLWIGTFRGLASWRDGKLTHYPELDGQIIEALLEDREGNIWVAGWTPSLGRLCRIQNGNTECYGQDGRFGSGITALYEDRRGNLWAGTTTGLWRWQPGPPKFYSLPNPSRVYAMAENQEGDLVVARLAGIIKLRSELVEALPLPRGVQFQPYRLLRDRDGSLWIGAVVDGGLLHIHGRRTDQFTHADGLTDNSISCLFEDREGNVWVATTEGIERFRDFAIPRVSADQGLSGQGVFSVLAANDGSVWVAASDGLHRWKDGQLTIYRKQSLGEVGGYSPLIPAGGLSIRQVTETGLPDYRLDCLFQDDAGQIWVAGQHGIAIFKSDRFVPVRSMPQGTVFSITSDGARNVWVSHEEGLFRFLDERLVERIPWSQLGRQQPATALLSERPNGGLWLGFRDGGVGYFKDGQLHASYAAAEGLGEGLVRSFYADRDGALWVANEGGLSRIKDGRVLTLTSHNGLPCKTVHWMIEDDQGSVWLYMACGLARIARSELDTWASDPKRPIHPIVFDSSDGVRNRRYSGGYTVAKTSDGRIWFLTSDDVSVIDPHRLAFNKVPPPVQIEQVTADGKTYDPANGLRLPPGVSDLMFDFAALSFVAPEKVRVRVMLEGQDNDWRDLINQRRVHYTNLPPRNYRFRVIACNNSGVCDEEGEFLDFSIAPAFYQRTSFRVLCAVGLVALLFAGYRLRVHQLARQFNRTLEARVSERTRIARDLHDTLLQSYQGLLLRFQSAWKLLPERPVEAKDRLGNAIEQAAAAITEGRDAVQGLRSSAFESNDLANAISAMAEELTRAASPADAPTIDVEVEGPSRNLNPVVRDEAYRIATEALRNALHHAHATRIKVEIAYNKRRFRLGIRDDGKGIEQATIQQQPAGHFGLPGMRERAEIVGGRLDVWSAPGSGTHVELSIPAAVAYKGFRRNSRKTNQAAAGA